jgi:hypothetical protein
MTPKGILNKIVWKLSNPNDLTIREPKLEMPPLAILLQMLVSSNSLFSSRGNLPKVQYLRDSYNREEPAPSLEV